MGVNGLMQLLRSDETKIKVIEELYLIEGTNQEFNKIFPLDLHYIAQEQKCNEQLESMKAQGHTAQLFGITNLENAQLLIYKEQIWVPQSLQWCLLSWHHNSLQHAGATEC